MSTDSNPQTASYTSDETGEGTPNAQSTAEAGKPVTADHSVPVSANAVAETQPPNNRTCRVEGVFQTEGADPKPIHAAVVFHAASGSMDRTSIEGRYALELPCHKKTSGTLRILARGYRPVKVNVELVPGKIVAIKSNMVAPKPIPEFLTENMIGKLLSIFYPGLWLFWLHRTRMEKWLVAGAVPVLGLPLLLFALDMGLPIPGTDFDEWVRESMQRVSLSIFRKEINYSKVRPVYFGGINYRISKGSYEVRPPEGTVRIQKNAKVIIEAGTEFKMAEDTGFLVFGKLQAYGSGRERIRFVRSDPNKKWKNITIWEPESSESTLQFCDIVGGSGCGVEGTNESVFQRKDSGSKAGGGLLLYATSASLYDVNISDCAARYGGGIFIRDEPDHRMSGASLKIVNINGCTATHETLGGGGAVFVRGTFPEFVECKFVNNKAVGPASCGGAVYLGTKGRAKFTKCAFEKNVADAEGGAIYGQNSWNEGEDIHGTGLVALQCTFNGNKARGRGGAISTLNVRTTIIGPTDFSDNSVSSNRKLTESAGGGISLKYDGGYKGTANNVIRHCNFELNKAESVSPSPQDIQEFAGGGISISSVQAVGFEFGNLIFTGNSAYTGAHAILPHSLVVKFRAALASMASPPDGEGGAAVAVRGKGVGGLASREIQPVETFLAASGDRPVGATISCIVVHRILDEGILHPSTTKSAHYAIRHDGVIFRLLPEGRQAWHIDRGRLPNGSENIQPMSIGIWMMMQGIDEPVSETQVESLAWLICDIQKRHKQLTMAGVYGCDEIRYRWKKTKGYPIVESGDELGPLFPWQRVFALISAQK